MAEPEIEPFDDNDNPERGTVSLSAEEQAKLEREKRELLSGLVVVRGGDPRPAARRRTGLSPDEARSYPDQTAQHLVAQPAREELEAEFGRPQQVVKVTRVPGVTHTIEALAAQVREDEERLKESKSLLRRALKRLGVK